MTQNCLSTSTDSDDSIIEIDISRDIVMPRQKAKVAIISHKTRLRLPASAESSIQSVSTDYASKASPMKQRIVAPLGGKWRARVISAFSFDSEVSKLVDAVLTKKPENVLQRAEVDDEPEWECAVAGRAVDLQSALDRPAKPWRFRKAVLVSKDLELRRRRYPSRWYKQNGLYIVDRAWAVDALDGLAVMPLWDTICNTELPRRFTLAADAQLSMMLSTLNSFDDCLSP